MIPLIKPIKLYLFYFLFLYFYFYFILHMTPEIPSFPYGFGSYRGSKIQGCYMRTIRLLGCRMSFELLKNYENCLLMYDFGISDLWLAIVCYWSLFFFSVRCWKEKTYGLEICLLLIFVYVFCLLLNILCNFCFVKPLWWYLFMSFYKFHNMKKWL